MKKRILPLLLTLCMLLTLLPTAAFAAGDETAAVTSFDELQAALADDSVEAIEISGEIHVDPWEGGNTLRVTKPIVDEDEDGLLILGEGVCIIGAVDNMLFAADNEADMYYLDEEFGRSVALFGSWEDALDKDAELYAAHEAAGKPGMPVGSMNFYADDTIVIGRNGPQQIAAQGIFFNAGQNVVIESGSFVWTGRLHIMDWKMAEIIGEEEVPEWEWYQENRCGLTIKEGAAVEAVALDEDRNGMVYTDGKITVEGDLFVGPGKTGCAYRPIVCAPKDVDFAGVEGIYYPSAEAAMEAIGATDKLTLEDGSAEVKLCCLLFHAGGETDDRGRVTEFGWTIQPDGADKFSGEGLTLEDLEDGSVRITAKPGVYQMFFEDQNAYPLDITSIGENPFTDVAESNWFFKQVQWAATRNIVAGTTPTTFSPGQTCTQAQILTMIYAAAGKPAPTAACPYANVTADKYYYDAVRWAVEKGILTGDTFSPNDPCTRADTVTYLYRNAGSPAARSAAQFSDVAANAPYAPAVAWAVESGVTAGMGDGTFGSTATCTRAQIVTFLKAALG